MYVKYAFDVRMNEFKRGFTSGDTMPSADTEVACAVETPVDDQGSVVLALPLAASCPVDYLDVGEEGDEEGADDEANDAVDDEVAIAAAVPDTVDMEVAIAAAVPDTVDDEVAIAAAVPDTVDVEVAVATVVPDTIDIEVAAAVAE